MSNDDQGKSLSTYPLHNGLVTKIHIGLLLVIQALEVIHSPSSSNNERASAQAVMRIERELEHGLTSLSTSTSLVPTAMQPVSSVMSSQSRRETSCDISVSICWAAVYARIGQVSTQRKKHK